MHYSITGFAYLTLLVTLGYLIYRFFQYWKKEKDTVARQSFYFTGLFGLFVLINTVSGLFFADNSFLLEKISGAASFIQVLAFAAMAYHIVFLKFPRISPWWGFSPILILGLITVVLSVTSISLNPFLDQSGAIN